MAGYAPASRYTSRLVAPCSLPMLKTVTLVASPPHAKLPLRYAAREKKHPLPWKGASVRGTFPSLEGESALRGLVPSPLRERVRVRALSRGSA